MNNKLLRLIDEQATYIEFLESQIEDLRFEAAYIEALLNSIEVKQDGNGQWR